jgi:hypothetical protein
MPYCTQCRRSDVASHWEFCPRCGATLTPDPPAPDRPGGDVKDMLVGFAWTAAEQFVKGRIQQKLGPLAQVVDQAFSAPAIVGSTAWPEWYAAAVAEQQPTMDSAELARVQAEEVTRARTATEMARAAIETAKSMTATLGRASD